MKKNVFVCGVCVVWGFIIINLSVFYNLAHFPVWVHRLSSVSTSIFGAFSSVVA